MVGRGEYYYVLETRSSIREQLDDIRPARLAAPPHTHPQMSASGFRQIQNWVRDVVSALCTVIMRAKIIRHIAAAHSFRKSIVKP